jgi:vancomycin resistance protein VanW
LRNGKLVLETGGGLCQLASALYAAGLKAGLDPAERHAHSIDLYTDETRFAVLGSDATVSYGFKDLRLRNPHTVAVSFLVTADDSHLTVRALAESPVNAASIEYRTVASGPDFVETETWADGHMVARDRYIRGANHSV